MRNDCATLAWCVLSAASAPQSIQAMDGFGGRGSRHQT
jgi:hypothetical protein